MTTLKQINEKVFVENKRITAVVGTIMIFIVIAAVFSFEASGIETSDAKTVMNELRDKIGISPGIERPESKSSLNFNGQTSQNSDTPQSFVLEHEALIRVSASLSWNDEDPGPGRTNKADEFKIELKSPSGESVESSFVTNSESGNLAGSIPAITLELVESEDNTGEWVVTVYAGDCGDFYGPLGRFSYQDDNGNDWTLSITYTYFAVE